MSLLKPSSFLSIVSASTLCLLGSTSAYSQLAKWTFETSIPNTSGPYAAEIGTGFASGSHAGTASYSSPAGDGSPHSYNANNWGVGDYWQFSTSTLGDAAVKLEWDQVSSTLGPGSFSLSYSTDGTSFTPYVSSYSVLGNVSWSQFSYNASTHFSFDLSSVTALNNASTVYFRLIDNSTTSASGGTVASTATDRIDNFTITATPQAVPEPASFALFGFGALAVAGARRFKK
jgi:hypothetical protein